MGNIFNPEGPFMRLMNKISYLMILNLIFIICCIPIITIGPAITALYSVTFKMIDDVEGSVVKEYFRAFKDNFRQATILWVIVFALGLVLIADLLITCYFPIKFAVVLYVTSCFIGAMFVLLLSYVFPLQCMFENSVCNTLKNALILALSNMFPTTLAITLINIAPILLLWFKTYLFIKCTPFVITFLFSVSCYINCKLLRPVFGKYIDSSS